MRGLYASQGTTAANVISTNYRNLELAGKPKGIKRVLKEYTQ